MHFRSLNRGNVAVCDKLNGQLAQEAEYNVTECTQVEYDTLIKEIKTRIERVKKWKEGLNC